MVLTSVSLTFTGLENKSDTLVNNQCFSPLLLGKTCFLAKKMPPNKKSTMLCARLKPMILFTGSRISYKRLPEQQEVKFQVGRNKDLQLLVLFSKTPRFYYLMRLPLLLTVGTKNSFKPLSIKLLLKRLQSLLPTE